MLSEKTFKTIFSDTIDGILIVEVRHKKIFMANHIFCEMIGYSEEELKEFTLKDIHPSEDFAMIEKAFQLCSAGENPIVRDIPFRRKNGSLFYTDIKAFPIHSKNQLYLMGIISDITCRKQIEGELSFKNIILKTQMEMSPDGILILDKKGNLILSNKRVYDMWNMPQNLRDNYNYEVHFQHILSLLKNPEKDARVLRDLFKDKEETQRFEIELKDGRIFDRYSVPMLDPDGKYLGRISFYRDISDYRKIEQELRKSEETFRLAMDAANDALWDWNLVTNETYRNPRHATMLGYQPEELTKSNDEWVTRIHPDDKAKVLEFVHECLNGNKVRFGIEYRLRKKSGDYIWVLGRGKVVESNEKGEPLRFVGTNIDITDRKKTEEALRESENKYKALVESAGETIAIINDKGEFLFVNEVAATRLGGKPEDFKGKTMWELFPKEIADRQINSIRRSISQKTGLTITSNIKLYDEYRWFETTITPLENNDGTVSAAIIYARDITENKKTQEKLDDYRDEIAHSERLASLGTLSANAAHELAQPLTVISLLIENAAAKLENGASAQAVVEKLRESLVEISNITSIVDRLRNFARKSSGQVQKRVQINKVANRIVNLLSESSRHSGVKLIVSDLDELPPVYSNEKDLEQLFFALIDNAIYAAGDRHDPQLVISGATCDDYIELRFADNCGGISSENREKIFQPFFTTKPDGRGTGLGLCIVSDIVSRAGGKIRVESVYGEGSTFIIMLPLNRNGN